MNKLETERASGETPRTAVPVIGNRLWILLLALTAIGVTGCYQPSGEVRALSERLSRSAGGHCELEIAIGVGSVPFTLLRAGLAFAEVEPEVRAALGTVRGVEVNIYELRAGRRAPDQSVLLAAADETMTERGWDRVVGVLSSDELVAVYVPADLKSTRNVRLCVVVLDGRELVVASIRGNPEPLMELALAEVAKTKGDRRAPWAGRWQNLGEFGADNLTPFRKTCGRKTPQETQERVPFFGEWCGF